MNELKRSRSSNLTPRETQFLVVYLQYWGNIEAACRKIKLSKATAYKFLRDPKFQIELRKAQNRLYRSALDHLTKFQGRARERLTELINNPNPTVSLAAIKLALTGQPKRKKRGTKKKKRKHRLKEKVVLSLAVNIMKDHPEMNAAEAVKKANEFVAAHPDVIQTAIDSRKTQGTGSVAKSKITRRPFDGVREKDKTS